MMISFFDSLCLMWALCCLSDVMNITMAAEPFEICASHSICSPKNAWYNCSFQRGSQPWSFCGGFRTTLYKMRRYSWSLFVVSILYAVFFMKYKKRNYNNKINWYDFDAVLLGFWCHKIGFSMNNEFSSVTHSKLLCGAMNTCNIAHKVKWTTLWFFYGTFSW